MSYPLHDCFAANGLPEMPSTPKFSQDIRLPSSFTVGRTTQVKKKPMENSLNARVVPIQPLDSWNPLHLGFFLDSTSRIPPLHSAAAAFEVPVVHAPTPNIAALLPAIGSWIKLRATHELSACFDSSYACWFCPRLCAEANCWLWLAAGKMVHPCGQTWVLRGVAW